MIAAAVGFVAGMAIGAAYFGGLWITLTRAETSRWPPLLLAGSYLLRLSIAGVGFGLLAVRGIVPVAAGLLGFLLVRTVLVHRLRPRVESTAGDGDGSPRGVPDLFGDGAAGLAEPGEGD